MRSFRLKVGRSGTEYAKDVETREIILQNFYGLYAIDYMHFFADKKWHLPDKVKLHIESKREELILWWFTYLEEALFYSVYREGRHLFDSLKDNFMPDHLKKWAEKLWDMYINDGNDLDKIFAQLKATDFDFSLLQLEYAFNSLKWCSGFGGKSWGQGVTALLSHDKRRDINAKMLWVDHVLDLQHNNGFILNKTSFAVLEQFPKNCSLWWKYSNENHLDWRFKADLEQLVHFADKEIKNLSRYFGVKLHFATLPKTEENIVPTKPVRQSKQALERVMKTICGLTKAEGIVIAAPDNGIVKYKPVGNHSIVVDSQPSLTSDELTKLHEKE